MQGNKTQNFEALKEILRKQPNSKFVYFRRLGEGFKGDIIDVPMKQAEFMIKQFPMWELVQAIEQIKDDVAALFNEDEEVAPVELKKEETLEVPPLPESISDKEFETIMSEGKELTSGTSIDEIKTVELPVGKATKVEVKKTRKYHRRGVKKSKIKETTTPSVNNA
jgi:hypothetical protein